MMSNFSGTRQSTPISMFGFRFWTSNTSRSNMATARSPFDKLPIKFICIITFLSAVCMRWTPYDWLPNLIPRAVPVGHDGHVDVGQRKADPWVPLGRWINLTLTVPWKISIMGIATLWNLLSPDESNYLLSKHQNSRPQMINRPGSPRLHSTHPKYPNMSSVYL